MNKKARFMAGIATILVVIALTMMVFRVGEFTITGNTVKTPPYVTNAWVPQGKYSLFSTYLESEPGVWQSAYTTDWGNPEYYEFYNAQGLRLNIDPATRGTSPYLNDKREPVSDSSQAHRSSNYDAFNGPNGPSNSVALTPAFVAKDNLYTGTYLQTDGGWKSTLDGEVYNNQGLRLNPDPNSNTANPYLDGNGNPVSDSAQAQQSANYLAFRSTDLSLGGSAGVPPTGASLPVAPAPAPAVPAPSSLVAPTAAASGLTLALTRSATSGLSLQGANPNTVVVDQNGVSYTFNLQADGTYKYDDGSGNVMFANYNSNGQLSAIPTRGTGTFAGKSGYLYQTNPSQSVTWNQQSRQWEVSISGTAYQIGADGQPVQSLPDGYRWDQTQAQTAMKIQQQQLIDAYVSQQKAAGSTLSNAELQKLAVSALGFPTAAAPGTSAPVNPNQRTALQDANGNWYVWDYDGKNMVTFASQSDADTYASQVSAALSQGLKPSGYFLDSSVKTPLFTDKTGTLYTFDSGVKKQYTMGNLYATEMIGIAGSQISTIVTYQNNNGKPGAVVSATLPPTMAGGQGATLDPQTYADIKKQNILSVENGVITYIDAAQRTVQIDVSTYNLGPNGVWSGTKTTTISFTAYLDASGGLITLAEYQKQLEQGLNPKQLNNIQLVSSHTYAADGSLLSTTISDYSVRDGQVWVDSQTLDPNGGILSYTFTTYDSENNQRSVTIDDDGNLIDGDADLVAQAQTRKTQFKFRSNLARFEFVLKEFQGLSGFSRLLWGEDELARRQQQIDQAFCETIVFGSEDCQTSLLCEAKIDSIPDNVLVVNTPYGLLSTAAHIEGERAPATIDPNGTTQYLYKINIVVDNVANSGYGEINFNVFLYGDQKTAQVFSSNIKISEGQSVRKTGNNTIVQYSSTIYNKACLKFDRALLSVDRRDVTQICVPITEYAAGATPYIPANQTTTTRGGSSSDQVSVNDF